MSEQCPACGASMDAHMVVTEYNEQGLPVDCDYMECPESAFNRQATEIAKEAEATQ